MKWYLSFLCFASRASVLDKEWMVGHRFSLLEDWGPTTLSVCNKPHRIVLWRGTNYVNCPKLLGQFIIICGMKRKGIKNTLLSQNLYLEKQFNNYSAGICYRMNSCLHRTYKYCPAWPDRIAGMNLYSNYRIKALGPIQKLEVFQDLRSTSPILRNTEYKKTLTPKVHLTSARFNCVPGTTKCWFCLKALNSLAPGHLREHFLPFLPS